MGLQGLGSNFKVKNSSVLCNTHFFKPSKITKREYKAIIVFGYASQHFILLGMSDDVKKGRVFETAKYKFFGETFSFNFRSLKCPNTNF